MQGYLYIGGNQALPTSVASSGGGNIITALNKTSSAVSSGDKVWLNQESVYFYNFDVVGAPTIDNTTEVVSGFSTSNYIKAPDTFDYTQPFQIYVKFTTPSSISAYTPVTGTVAIYSIVPFYFMKNDFTLCAFGSSNGSSWNLFSNVTVKTCSANTTYTMMFEFTGSAYVWYEYENGTWVELTRVTSSTPCYSGGEVIFGKANMEAWIGSIDLSETKITTNGSDLWVPSFTYADCQIIEFNKQRNFSVVGNPTINDNTEIVSDFTSSNYLTFPKEFNPGNNPWEGIIKFTTGSNFGTSSYTSLGILGNTDSADLYKGPTIHFIRDGRMQFLVGNGSSWINAGGNIGYYTGSYYAQTNTTYWLKFGWTGSQYYLEYSLDRITYTRDITAPFNTQMTGNIPTFGIVYGQTGRYDYSLLPFNGSIDFSETSIKINNGNEWKGYYSYITENTLTGVAKENIASGSTGRIETILPEE